MKHFSALAFALALSSCSLDIPEAPLADNPWDPNNPNAPRAPESVRGTVVAESVVRLDWLDQSGNELGFLVKYASGDSTENLDWQVVDSVEASANQVTIDSLPPDVLYFKIAAWNLAGNSNSNDIGVRLDMSDALPNAPAELRCELTDGTGIRLIWQDRSAIELRYDIQTSDDSLDWNTKRVLPFNSTEWLDESLDPYTAVYYRVRAANGFGASNYFTASSILPGDVPMAMPYGLTAQTLTEYEVILSWLDTNKVAETYRILRSMDDTLSFAEVEFIYPEEDASYVHHIRQLESNHNYYFRVIARNRLKSSQPSTIASASTSESIPFPPLNLRATVEDELDVVLTWEDNSEIETGYEIEESAGDLLHFGHVESVAANQTGWRREECVSNMTYYYRVRAIGNLGRSGWVNAGPVTPVLIPPSNVRVQIDGNELDVAVTWDDNSAAESGYEVIESVGDSLNYVSAATLSANTTSWRRVDCEPFVVRFYRVRALGSTGNSVWANGPSIVPGTFPPNGPSLQARAISPTEILLSWQDVSRVEERFEIEEWVSGQSHFWQRVAVPESDTEQVLLTNRTANTSYSYRIRASNRFGDSPWSASADVTTPGPPPVPTNLAAVGLTDSTIQISWITTNNQHTGYVLQDSPTGEIFVFLDSIGNPNQHQINVAPRERYNATYYRIQAYNEYGSSAWSNIDGATPLYALMAIAMSNGGVKIVDVTDIGSPVDIRTVDTPGLALRVVIENTRAYVADSYGGVRIIDFASPADATEIGSFDTEGRAYDIVVRNNMAYVADGDSGLAIISFANPASPSLRARLRLQPGIGQSLAIFNGYLYIAAQGRGVLRVNATNPSTPSITHEAATGSSAQGVCIVNSQVASAEFAAGMRVLNGANVSEINSLALPGTSLDIAAGQSGYYYVSNSNRNIYIAYWNPQPNEVGSFPVGDDISSIEYIDGRLYVAADNAGVLVYDCADPRSPSLIGTIRTGSPARGIAITSSR